MPAQPKVFFVTGTDTGVGKTLFTGLLLQHLRGTGLRALAMKPFCSGSRADARLLQSLQRGELSDDEMNPYYFRQPVAPLVAREARGKRIAVNDVLVSIRRVQAKCEVLLIEGSGGLLVPLTKGLLVSDLIERIECQVLLVARNRLGTINHTLLTVQALQSIGRQPLAIALMAEENGDFSARTNAKVISDLLQGIPVFQIPFLGVQPTGKMRINARDSVAIERILKCLLGSIDLGIVQRSAPKTPRLSL